MLVMVALTVAACGEQTPAITATPDNAVADGGPIDPVRGYLEAVMSGGNTTPFFCSSMTDETRNQISPVTDAITTMNQQPGVTVELTGITYTVENETTETATVVLSGNVRVTLGDVSSESPVERLSFPVKNEDGWKICQ